MHGYNVIKYDVSNEASHFRTAQREVPTFVTRALHVYSFVEGRGPRIPFFKRLIRLDGNQLVMPLRVRQVDPIGEDIQDIPAVFQALQADWDAPAGSLNRMAAFTFMQRLRARMAMHDAGASHDGSIDRALCPLCFCTPVPSSLL